MKVIVVGAGVAGLTLAYALTRSGHRVVVVERAPGVKSDLHVLELSGVGHAAAERLGLLPDLEAVSAPSCPLVFHDADGGEFASIPYAVMRRTLFHGRHLRLTRGALERALYTKVRADVDVMFGVSLEGILIEGDVVRAKLDDGSAPAADLVVGADGARSFVRQTMFGLPEHTFRTPLGYRALAFVFDDSTLSRALGPAVHILAVPGRHVATFPVGPGRLACLLVHRSSDPNVDRSRDAIRAELMRVYAKLPWVTSLLLEHADRAGDLSFDVVSQVDVPQWSSGRVALLGDAAHGASLLSGHGASLAMAGALVLAEELARDPPIALARYEARMRSVAAAVQRAGREAGKWLVPDTNLSLLRHRVAARFVGWPLTSRVVRGAKAASVGRLLDASP